MEKSKFIKIRTQIEDVIK